MTTDLNCRCAGKKSARCSFPLGSNFVSRLQLSTSRSTGARAAGGAWPELRQVPVAWIRSRKANQPSPIMNNNKVTLQTRNSTQQLHSVLFIQI